MNTRAAYIVLNRIEGIGPVRTRALVEALGSPEAVLEASPAALAATHDAGIHLRGAGHITGGGIPSKFGRVLKKSGLGARLDRLFPPHDFMQKLMKIGNVDFETAYRQWNMGNAMLLVVPPAAADQTLSVLAARQVPAKLAGEIVPGPIVIQGVSFHP